MDSVVTSSGVSPRTTQIDCWWYPTTLQHQFYCGLDWVLPKEFFPSGMSGVRERLGTPLMMYMPAVCTGGGRWAGRYNWTDTAAAGWLLPVANEMEVRQLRRNLAAACRAFIQPRNTPPPTGQVFSPRPLAPPPHTHTHTRMRRVVCCAMRYCWSHAVCCLQPVDMPGSRLQAFFDELFDYGIATATPAPSSKASSDPWPRVWAPPMVKAGWAGTHMASYETDFFSDLEADNPEARGEYGKGEQLLNAIDAAYNDFNIACLRASSLAAATPATPVQQCVI